MQKKGIFSSLFSPPLPLSRPFFPSISSLPLLSPFLLFLSSSLWQVIWPVHQLAYRHTWQGFPDTPTGNCSSYKLRGVGYQLRGGRGPLLSFLFSSSVIWFFFLPFYNKNKESGSGPSAGSGRQAPWRGHSKFKARYEGEAKPMEATPDPSKQSRLFQGSPDLVSTVG